MTHIIVKKPYNVQMLTAINEALGQTQHGRVFKVTFAPTGAIALDAINAATVEEGAIYVVEQGLKKILLLPSSYQKDQVPAIIKTLKALCKP